MSTPIGGGLPSADYLIIGTDKRITIQETIDFHTGGINKDRRAYFQWMMGIQNTQAD